MKSNRPGGGGGVKEDTPYRAIELVIRQRGGGGQGERESQLENRMKFRI